jgi:hypothetical protein
MQTKLPVRRRQSKAVDDDVFVFVFAGTTGVVYPYLMQCPY